MSNGAGYAIAFDKRMKKCERNKKTQLTEFMNHESRITIKNGRNNDFVERWANFVKTHPRAVWKKQVGPLIDAQIILAEKFYARLAKTPGGEEKVKKLMALRKRAVY